MENQKDLEKSNDSAFELAWLVTQATAAYKNADEDMSKLSSSLDEFAKDGYFPKSGEVEQVFNSLLIYLKLMESPLENIVNTFGLDASAIDVYNDVLSMSEDDKAIYSEDAKRIVNVCGMIRVVSSLYDHVKGMSDDLKELKAYGDLLRL